MDIYTVSFFGHRQIYSQLLLDRLLDELSVKVSTGPAQSKKGAR